MALTGPRTALVVPLLLSVWALGACSDSSKPSNDAAGGDTLSPAPIDTNSSDQGGGDGALPSACVLLTPEEINAQFQYAVGDGVPSGPGGAICNWNTVDFHTEFSGVQLTVMELDQSYFDFVKGNVANRIDVPGLGDAAFWEAPQNPFVLNVETGNVHFVFYVVAGGAQFTPEAAQQLIINLANAVVARL